jgi:hypothetical protein
MRTTINIGDRILREIKAIQKREGRSMGAVISELLADALARRRGPQARPPLRWISRPMKALVDLAQKETIDGNRS